MDSVTRIRIVYALRKQGVRAEGIAGEVGRDRATVYRWLRGIRWYGIEGYIRCYGGPRKVAGCARPTASLSSMF